MLNFEPKEYPVPKVHKLLLGGVGPRPIALVSSLSKDGIPNLTPFSFFNAFGANPPIVAFSPARRGRDGTLKDTYNNLVDSKECVINAVTYPMVEQISLASTEYPSDVDEFIKSGLTPVDSDMVKPKRVKESPFQLECKLREMKSFGEEGGSANLAICEVVKFHIAEDIIEDGIIHPDRIDLAARMGGNFYCRASGNAIFEVAKPGTKKGIGYDQLPDFILKSDILSANNIAKLAGVETIPSEEDVEEFIKEIKSLELSEFEATEEAFFRFQRHNEYKKMLKAALNLEDKNHSKIKMYFELAAKTSLENGNTLFAFKTILYSNK